VPGSRDRRHRDDLPGSRCRHSRCRRSPREYQLGTLQAPLDGHRARRPARAVHHGEPWRTPLQQNIQKFLLKTGTAASTIRISSKKAGNLSQWRTWQTPTLADGPTVTGATNWTVTVAITAPQRVTTTWSGTFVWTNGGNTMTVTPDGSGSTFGFTTMTNGNSSARPRITSCTAS